MINPKLIKSTFSKYQKQLINIRRHLHAYPELSYQEYQTIDFIKNQLEKWNLEVTPCTPTGLFVVIKGTKPPVNKNQVLALRADIDALPIEEKTKLSFASKNKGVMHACGHDIHTTCLLGAIRILLDLQDKWSGTLKCIFQPGEEKNPGGASLMIKEGVLSKPPIPKAILGLHVLPSMPVGKLSFNHGKVMASADEIYITISSKGGHAALPHTTIDTVYVASKIVVELQELISRRKNPLTPSVLSICAIQGGHTTNIIPSSVKLQGTFRSLDEDWRWEAHKLIKQYIKGIAIATGAKIKVNISVGYPCVFNDKNLWQHNVKFAKKIVGEKNVLHQDVRMSAEDFGYYSHQIPACFFRVGSSKAEQIEKQQAASVHTPLFNPDEKVIGIGATSMAWLAINTLKTI